MKKHEAIRNAKNFDEILDIQYGKTGERKRDEFEQKAHYFVISETAMKPETTQPDADEPDELSALTDEELIDEMLRQLGIVTQLITDGADIDPRLLIEMDEANERFRQSVEAEKQSHELVRQTTEAQNKSADALLANPLTDQMKPIFAHAKAVRKHKSN